MNWITEHSMLVLVGLVVFMGLWLLASLGSNHQAKTDDGSHLNRDQKKSGATPIKNSDKV